MGHKQPIETLAELGLRFEREIRELVDLREITPAFATRVIDDLFEPAATGQQRVLRWSIWQAYVEELTSRSC